MHASVLQKWEAFSRPFEGYVNHLYADVRGLLTCGVGNLVDPVSLALRLPWKLPDGSLASAAEVSRQWHAVKAQSVYLAKRHFKYAAPLSTIRLTEVDIAALVVGKLLENERALKKAYPKWDEWPADAQLCALSMAWAVGAGFPSIFKNFSRFANAGDWVSAKPCAKIKEYWTDASGKKHLNAGLVPRNRANELCLDNAATVVEQRLDPSVLHWPNVAKSTALETPKSATPEITDADRARINAFFAEFTRQAREQAHADKMAELAGIDSMRPSNDEGPNGAA
jgi:GH24 family phage-related lysozyme (muramidase)